MVTKNQIKFISNLHQKKFRIEHHLFVAEGKKVIHELLDSGFKLHHLYELKPIFTAVEAELKTQITELELQKMSALVTANDCLAIFEIPLQKGLPQKGLIVALDDIRDPGNLGTIVRLCDWFGIQKMVCSMQTVDVFNPKVVQATMGSIGRVEVVYTDLALFLKSSKLPVYGTFLNGENIYKSVLPSDAIVVFGNEANGICMDIEAVIKNRLSVPRFGDLQATESLNVATATAIVLSEFRRSFL